MINKKVIVAILAVLVILTTVQGLKPVMAGDDTYNGAEQYYTVAVVVNGQGTVSWSGEQSGSTTTEALLNVPYGATVTFAAMGATWTIDSSSMSGDSYTLTGWAPATITDHVIIANFNQNLP